MLLSSQDWLKRLQEAPFPILSSSAKQIQEIIHTQSTNYTKLANIIRHDPGFSLQILRAINQTLSRKKTPIFSINQAISLLGMSWLEEHLDALPRLNEMQSNAQQQALAECYSRILYATDYVTYIAHQCRDPRPDELATATLLEHTAEMALWLYEPEIARRVSQLPCYGSNRVETSLTIFQTTTIEQLNHALLTLWNLPHPSDEIRVNSVKLASAISQASTKNWYSNEMLDLLNKTAEQTQQTVDEVASNIYSQAAETARNHHDLQLACPAYNLVFWPPFIQPKQIKTSTKIDEKKPPTANQKKDPKSTPKTTTQNNKVAIKKVADGTTVITRAMRQLHEGSELQRVVFIQLSADRKRLKVAKLIDKVPDSKLRQFNTNPHQDNLFGLLLRKPHLLWMDRERLQKHAKLIPESTMALLDSPEFFIASLFNQQHAIGLIFADNGHSGVALTQTMYTDFTRTCQQISNETKQTQGRSATSKIQP
ncbi:MAG: HDOD domain-containing protein [Candidatus Polarisedimenticolaceae bacterium]|nr:HDOD domain-containing protein [Candidatus Polarisedimenticolaceae bacterium]